MLPASGINVLENIPPAYYARLLNCAWLKCTYSWSARKTCSSTVASPKNLLKHLWFILRWLTQLQWLPLDFSVGVFWDRIYNILHNWEWLKWLAETERLFGIEKIGVWVGVGLIKTAWNLTEKISSVSSCRLFFFLHMPDVPEKEIFSSLSSQSSCRIQSSVSCSYDTV